MKKKKKNNKKPEPLIKIDVYKEESSSGFSVRAKADWIEGKEPAGYDMGEYLPNTPFYFGAYKPKYIGMVHDGEERILQELNEYIKEITCYADRVRAELDRREACRKQGNAYKVPFDVVEV